MLLNNAGTEYPTPLDDAAPESMTRWASLLDNNVTSMVRLTQALNILLHKHDLEDDSDNEKDCYDVSQTIARIQGKLGCLTCSA